MTSAGYISATEIYRLPECKRRLGMGRHSFTRLRRAGLPLLRIGRNVYVEGASVVAAMKVAAEQQAGDQAGGNGQGGGDA